MNTYTDDDGRCLLCGYALDVDGHGHDEDCRWNKG